MNDGPSINPDAPSIQTSDLPASMPSDTDSFETGFSAVDLREKLHHYGKQIRRGLSEITDEMRALRATSDEPNYAGARAQTLVAKAIERENQIQEQLDVLQLNDTDAILKVLHDCSRAKRKFAQNIIPAVHKAGSLEALRWQQKVVMVQSSYLLRDRFTFKQIRVINDNQEKNVIASNKRETASGSGSWPDIVAQAVAQSPEMLSDAETFASLADRVPEDRRDRLRAIAELGLRQVQLEAAQAAVDDGVHEARQTGASWDDIAAAVGLTAVSASRRWDANMQSKHRAYQAERRKRDSTS